MMQSVRLIEHTSNPADTRIIAVSQPQFLIGRGTDCDLRLLGTDISRHHCLLRVTDDEVVLMDLGSQNGTYRNNQRVLSQVELKTGDVIQVGECRLEIDLGDGNPVAPDEKMSSTTSTIVRKSPFQGGMPELPT